MNKFSKLLKDYPSVMSFMPILGSEFSYKISVEILGFDWLFRSLMHSDSRDESRSEWVFLVLKGNEGEKLDYLMTSEGTINYQVQKPFGIRKPKDQLVIDAIADNYEGFLRAKYLIFVRDTKKADKTAFRKIVVLKLPQKEIKPICIGIQKTLKTVIKKMK